jgi:hypothetical protein
MRLVERTFLFPSSPDRIFECNRPIIFVLDLRRVGSGRGYPLICCLQVIDLQQPRSEACHVRGFSDEGAAARSWEPTRPKSPMTIRDIAVGAPSESTPNWSERRPWGCEDPSFPCFWIPVV